MQGVAAQSLTHSIRMSELWLVRLVDMQKLIPARDSLAIDEATRYRIGIVESVAGLKFESPQICFALFCRMNWRCQLHAPKRTKE